MKKLNVFILSLLVLTVSSVRAAFTPDAGVKYYVVQNLANSQYVIGGAEAQPMVVNAENLESQQFEFVPVAGKADTYYIKNSSNKYLNKVSTSGWNVAYQDAVDGTNSEWVISGTTFDNIRLKVNAITGADGYLSSDLIASGSALYCNKPSNHVNGVLKLVKVSDVFKNGIVDGGFENAKAPSAPMGLWVSDPVQTLGDGYANGASRSRVNSGTNAVSGSKFFYVTFRQSNKNGYNAISTKVGGLLKGATYEFSFKYKQDGADNHLADVFASATANAQVADAIGGAKYTTTLDAKTSAQTGTFSFIAPSESCYIVFRNQQGGVSTEFNLYIDELSIVKTAEPQPLILPSVAEVELNESQRTKTIKISGVNLTHDITLLAPAGMLVSPSTLSANADNANVTLYFTGYEAFSGNLTMTSGSLTESLPITVSYATLPLSKKALTTGATGVESALASAKNFTVATDIREVETVTLPSLPTAYTIEVKAKVNSSEGRGLDLEVRDADKTGFRTAVDDEKIYNISVSNLPALFPTDVVGTNYRVYRYAVAGDKVNVFIDDKYYTTIDLTSGMKPNNLIDNGGFELDNLAGWTNPFGWGVGISGTQAFEGTGSLALGAWHGQALVTQYTTPIEAGDYEFSFEYMKTTGSNYRWGLSLDNNTTYLAGPWLSLGSAAWTQQSQDFTATDAADLLLSFWEWNNGSAIAVDNVELIKKEDATITPYISFGKAFGKGEANIDVEYVNYDLSGAYAPDLNGTSIDETADGASTILYANGLLHIADADGVLKIYSLSGSLVFTQNISGTVAIPLNLEQGVYIAQLGNQTIKFVK